MIHKIIKNIAKLYELSLSMCFIVGTAVVNTSTLPSQKMNFITRVGTRKEIKIFTEVPFIQDKKKKNAILQRFIQKHYKMSSCQEPWTQPLSDLFQRNVTSELSSCCHYSLQVLTGRGSTSSMGREAAICYDGGGGE